MAVTYYQKRARSTQLSAPVHVPAYHSGGARSIVSRRNLQMVLGAIWLLDGLLQLFPSMFTPYLVTGIMAPVMQGQPALVVAALTPVIHFAGQHVVLVNVSIAAVQIALGAALLLARFIRSALLASVIWAIVVWVGGEGFGMLLTGQASALLGAPGPVLLYALLGLLAYPVPGSRIAAAVARIPAHWFLAGFWTLAGLLQLQPTWWRQGQFAQVIAGNESPGTINGALLGPSLRWLAGVVNGGEFVLNLTFIVIAFGLAIGILVVPTDHLRPLLAGSISLSLLLWWATQGCGQLLTGGSTDVNSGPLLVVLALTCWPRKGADSSPPRGAFRLRLRQSIESSLPAAKHSSPTTAASK